MRRVARTLADLEDGGTIGEGHVAEAVQYRQRFPAEAAGTAR
jgi:predicted ATPase with chaperone activity